MKATSCGPNTCTACCGPRTDPPAHSADLEETLDAYTRDQLIAFQMRYRPARYDGVPDAETAALLDACTRPGGLKLLKPTPQAPYTSRF